MIAHINNTGFFKWTKYPDGQISLNLVSSLDHPKTIVARCSNYEDLMKICTLSDVYEHNNLKFRLFCPYIMASRSDRRFGINGSHDLKVITKILNNTNYADITVFDPHSDVLPSLLRNCEAKTLWDWAQPYLESIVSTNTILVSPDAGAYKKVFSLSEHKSLPIIPIVPGNKHRSSDGHIDLVIYGDVKDKDCIILDDIIDGGGTFIVLGEKLKSMGAKSVTLFVTHGLFHKGYNIQNVDQIYTTDSVKEHPEMSNLIVHKFFK